MATFRYSYKPPGVMGAGGRPPQFSGAFPASAFATKYPTFSWNGANPFAGAPSGRSIINAAAAQGYTGATSFSPVLNTSPPYPVAANAAGTPQQSAGLPVDYVNLINSIMGGLQGAGGGIDPASGIPLAQRALVQYGELPTDFQGLKLKNLSGAFKGSTAQLAQANTKSGISLVARMQQADADRQRYIKNSLAAHGILGSGETGFQYKREQTDYARARADSLGKLLDYLSNLNSGIAQYLQQQALMKQLQDLLAGLNQQQQQQQQQQDTGGTFGNYPGVTPHPYPTGYYGPGSYRTPGGNTLL